MPSSAPKPNARLTAPPLRDHPCPQLQTVLDSLFTPTPHPRRLVTLLTLSRHSVCLQLSAVRPLGYISDLSCEELDAGLGARPLLLTSCAPISPPLTLRSAHFVSTLALNTPRSAKSSPNQRGASTLERRESFCSALSRRRWRRRSGQMKGRR